MLFCLYCGIIVSLASIDRYVLSIILYVPFYIGTMIITEKRS